MLKKAGYDVINTDHKDDVLSNSWDAKPDLGIFEARGDEYCCLDLAKELYQSHDVPFIVISDCEEQEIISKAVLSGAHTYLLKPIRAGQLLPVIESAMQRANDIRRLQSAEQTLSTAINTARVISAAIGIMMERFRLTNKMAFEILRAEARSNQKKILDMANEILAAAETVNQFNLKKNMPE